MNAQKLEAEVKRLKKIIEAYEKFTAFTHQELLDADRTIHAQASLQNYTSEELKELRDRLQGLESDQKFADQIKNILKEDVLNEDTILNELRALRRESNASFLVDLFRVLVNHEFTEKEAGAYWEELQSHIEMLRNALGRPVGLRVALLDFFINQNRILKNPMIIEISIFDEMLKNSLLDDLTGIYNRRYFDRSLIRELNRARRHTESLSLFVLDVDNFKNFNDSYGHAAGDRVLQKIGALLQNTFRREDIVCRYGGEEFAVILPETDPGAAFNVCDRIRERLTEINIENEPISISGGIAGYPEHATDPANLFLIADRALYRAKLEGKNRIIPG